ncbi:type 1 glutamine amidotransferase domain-containing protein [Shewanella schlegeliana]|uniref:Type 1 glutamine amidotransferase domain-containing protein n=1 Tax=Shewanella schlegeliana TaxID=190308 RepID=A0ABS1T184_9GAMM|nr:type 1 glutamine amidotransferase domain-containing protein [Shewanella schlegeliana]MBL4914547.1 type 1 glutamine amidotransferase domain-containing protein [Shewanella schlegeliana]MCL1109637.1 type 1 glutamine amidotransferase domain-containing protein [Shewanella schlegeliana]GIU30034.1 dimethylallyltransferase [Shewanella schlegeliana]
MKILMVLTSHDKLGDTGLKTGFWLEEFASPFYRFKDSGFQITLASPAGGQPPLDPNSEQADFQTAATERFNQDEQAKQLLATTHVLVDIDQADYDAVFYPGGHGPLWDLTNDAHSIALIEAFYQANKPVGLVCHAPGALKNVKAADGSPLVAGKQVTGFTNGEEAAVQLTEIVPFLVEDMMLANGALYTKGDDWASHLAVDGNLITGQNPASSEVVADEIIKQLK